MVETEMPEFVMFSAREAMAGGLTHIEEQVKSIERAVVEKPGLALDLAKTLIESTCKTILTERSVAHEDGDDLPKLFRMVRQALPFLPVAAAGEADARRSLDQTLNGLHTALQGICELRNNYGFASHGAEAARPGMGSTQAALAAQAADTIIGFLYRIHRQDVSQEVKPVLGYDDQPDFNQYVDDSNKPVLIFTLEYRPSEVLFSVDLDAYKDALESYETPADEEQVELQEPAEVEMAP